MNRCILGVFCLILSALFANKEISERGYWIGDVAEWHITDWNLAEAIIEFLRKENAQSVVDFGCGEGDYVRYFQDIGFESIGYDGNPNTPTLTLGAGEVLDLSEPFDLGKTYDWVISLEVGEHLPHQYEKIFIENLMRHAKNGIILSWAFKGQGGTGHFNEQNNDYIKSLFSKYGYSNDIEVEDQLRQECSVGWFAKTIMVFRTPQNGKK